MSFYARTLESETKKIVNVIASYYITVKSKIKFILTEKFFDFDFKFTYPK